jgi:transketolase
MLGKIANTIRDLSMDAVQKADSGHPGLPMGCAEIGAYLFGVAMRYNPQNPHWTNRDRFILSAGHGSMLLYSCLHLAGFPLTLEDIKNFRQLHSKTPGHPESRDTEGVETTTGPLGQGIGNAIGQALGLKLLGTKFNTSSYSLLNPKVFVLMGDGCIMEGATSEVSSLVGHLKLDNLIAIYDSNHICLDGPTSETLSEDTAARYKAYGWDVYTIDGYDLDALHQIISNARIQQEKPLLIIAHTIIGKGSPNKAGTHKAHGSPLGPEEVMAAKKALGLPEEPFYIPQAVKDFFSRKRIQDEEQEKQWNALFEGWARQNQKLHQEFEAMKLQKLPSDLEEGFSGRDPGAWRSAPLFVWGVG